MSGEEPGKQILNAGGVKQSRSGAYSTKDFQLDVLGQLAEMQAVTQELRDALANPAEQTSPKNQEQSSLLRFDGRTLVAIGAIALSLTGYVLQDARNTTRRDAEIEATKARVTTLEGSAAVNTEGRIRTEVGLGELRQGQQEIKALLQAHDNASRKALAKKLAGERGQE